MEEDDDESDDRDVFLMETCEAGLEIRDIFQLSDVKIYRQNDAPMRLTSKRMVNRLSMEHTKETEERNEICNGHQLTGELGHFNGGHNKKVMHSCGGNCKIG